MKESGKDNKKVLRIGHSPDPDDAFMFFGLSHIKELANEYELIHVVEDIESLNKRAFKGELEVTAISAHVYPSISHLYRILKTGASMGFGYGPVLVSAEPCSPESLKYQKVAHPGRYTTACLLMKMYLEDVEPVELAFDRIIPALKCGAIKAGILIHEGQLTYTDHGLFRVMDFGEIWFQETGLPLPLGLDVIRADIGEACATMFSDALEKSIRYGYENPDRAIPFSMQYGRGIDRSRGEKFVKMYVNDFTINMGETGKNALQKLYNRAFELGHIPEIPCLNIY